MKKSLLLILLTFFISDSNAQFFPFQPVTEIPYFSPTGFHDRVMIQDSFIYECRSGGLQILNVNNGTTEYRWKNHYYLKMLLPDMHGNYIFLKDISFIGVFDTLLNDYKNINTGALANNYISSIGISPNGNIWTLGSNNLGIYNGTNWQVYPYNGNSLISIKVINDTSAYLSGYPFFRFHNGVFDTLFTLPTNTSLYDWDVDSLGNLWIAGRNKLIFVHDTTMVFFDSTNTPVGSEKFLKVVVGKNGHVWTCGEKEKLFEYDGITWSTHTLSNQFDIDNFNLDSLSRPWVIAGYSNNSSSSYFSYMNTYIWNGGSFNTPVSFTFMPYSNIKEMGFNSIANDDGIFIFNSNDQYFRVGQFFGSPKRPEANDVNCFRTFTQYTGSGNMAFGTHSGIYNNTGTETGLDTSVLPSDTVNYIYNYNGNDYVCTDKGLLIYNGVFYNTLDTSNSPLPSNKITFAIVAQGQTHNKLYIGTDNGVAIYSNNHWTVFDSSDLGLSSFYVTGILPPVFWFGDTVIYVSTLGSGLIKLYDSGGFDILNTANGTFQDDSLYYVIPADLGDCGYYILIGTNENGLAAFNYWMGNFEYYNTSNGYPFSQSRAAVDNIFYGGNILMGTNTGLYWTSPCGGIGENSVSNNIIVYPNPSSGIFTIAQPSMSKIEIHNIVGELIYKTISTDEKITVDLSKQAKGMYFISATDRNKRVCNKKLIIQ